MIGRKTTVLVALLILFGLGGTLQAAPADGSCDRECLKGFITKYLDAMTAHKPESLPVADNVKFTEDCKEIQLGEGIWKNFSGLTDYRRDILDVKQGVAVSFLVVNENDSPVLFVMRLKVDGNKIAEIETMAVRNREEGMLFNLDNLKTVSPTMLYEPKESEKVPREKAIKMALTYPEGLKVGSFVKVDSPMAEKAYRFENGQQMAGPGCQFPGGGCENMKEQFIPTLSEITYRVVGMDEKLGVVVVRMNFGRGSTFGGNGVLDVWHSFKIYNNLIQAAEAYCEVVPAGTKSGWE